MDDIPRNSYIVTNDPALNGFFNEVKEAVKEYIPKSPNEGQYNVEKQASHFSPTTRAKTQWLMDKTSKIKKQKQMKGYKKRTDRLEDLIKQSHKTIRDIETAKRELLKVQHQVMEVDEELETLNHIHGGYKTNRSQINNGEPPESDKREDTGFLIKAITALESRLHKSNIHVGKAKHRAEVLKQEINSKRYEKQKAKRLALSWMNTVKTKQDQLQSLNKQLHHVKGEINYLQREIKYLKETEHKEAVKARAQIRLIAAEKIRQRAAHRKVLVAPKQISASVRRQNNLKAMQKNKVDGDSENIEEDLMSNPEDQHILDLINKKKQNKSLRQITGSVERYGVEDKKSNNGISKSSQQRPASSIQPRRPIRDKKGLRPSTSSGPGNRRKKPKWHPGAVSKAVSRLDGKPIPTGRRGGLIGKAPGRTLHGKMSAKVELLLSRVPNADAIKQKTQRNILVTKWKLARNQAEQVASGQHGAREYERAFGKVLEQEGHQMTIDKFVQEFLEMEQKQSSLIRQMEHSEEELKDVTVQHEMLMTEQNDLEDKIGISKKKTAEGKQSRMDKLNKQEQNAIEVAEKFKETQNKIKNVLTPIYKSLKDLVSAINSQPIVANLFGKNTTYSSDLMRDGNITDTNVEKILGELESTISEIFEVVSRWDEMANSSQMTANRRSVRRANASSPYGGRRSLVGGVHDQMERRKSLQTRSLSNAVRNRHVVKHSLDNKSAGSNPENDMEVQRYTASSSPTLRKRTAVTSVALPREEEVSASFVNEGYDSDDDANTILHRNELQETAKELYRRRTEIENFMKMQSAQRHHTSAKKKLALETEAGYGSTKGMRFTRKRQGYKPLEI
jgi:seryl-tRNA synthetase